MRLAFAAIASAFDHATFRVGPLTIANLLATVLSLPSLAVAGMCGWLTGSWPVAIGIALLLIVILPNPAATGVHYLAHGFTREAMAPGVEDIATGFQMYGLLTCKVWLLGVVGTAIMLGNLAFYISLQSPIGLVLRAVWVYVLLLWIGAHLYVFPLLMEQQVKRVLLIYRNAISMSVTRPLFTLVAALAWLFVVAVTSLTAVIVVLGLGLAATIQQNATVHLLTTFDEPEQ